MTQPRKRPDWVVQSQMPSSARGEGQSRVTLWMIMVAAGLVIILAIVFIVIIPQGAYNAAESDSKRSDQAEENLLNRSMSGNDSPVIAALAKEDAQPVGTVDPGLGLAESPFMTEQEEWDHELDS